MAKASWILLALLAVLTLVGSLASTGVALGGGPDQLGAEGPTIRDVEAWRPEAAQAVRGRRSTAAAYAAGFATLFLFVVLGPYRRGEVWSWWAVLGSWVLYAVLVVARVPLLNTSLGVGTALVQLGIVALALALGSGRLRASRSTASP